MADTNTDKPNDLKTMISIATEGLSNKNKELLGKIKNQQAALDKFKDVDLDKLLKAQETLTELQNSQDEQDGNFKKLYEKQVLTHRGEVTKLTNTNKELQKQLDNTATSIALQKTLTKNHIDPVLLDAAEALLHPAINTQEEIEPAVEKWLSTDVGKRFISDGNSGGGAGGPGGDIIPEADYYNRESKNYSLTKQAQIANQNPELHTTLSKQFPAKTTV